MSDDGSSFRGQVRGVKDISHRSGFTLLEILLALSILVLVVTAVYVIFSTAEKNIEQAESIRDNTDIARTLMAKIADDIANSYISPSMAGQTIFYGKKEEFGTGNDKRRYDSLSLTTLTNWRLPDSKEMELWEVGYFFKEKPDGTGFLMMRREKRELSKDVPVLEGGIEYQITDRVEGLQLRYNNGGDLWLDEWDSRKQKNQLPKTVEIQLILVSDLTYTARVDVSK
ncbi:MAG TPA: type II secretion system protein GspJ [Nitrospirota bacterium]|nr:type II secretion system protein GspJ [Nitrospirota bacterium]